MNRLILTKLTDKLNSNLTVVYTETEGRMKAVRGLIEDVDEEFLVLITRNGTEHIISLDSIVKVKDSGDD